MPLPVDGLLVKVRSSARFGAAAARILDKAEPILEVPAGTPTGFGLAAGEHATWMRIPAGDDAWDRAHEMMAGGFAADSAGVVAAEPDIAQSWPEQALTDKQACVAAPQTTQHGIPAGPHFAWHLDDAFSGLRSARDAVPITDQAKVIVAHLDTGYDPAHHARPGTILHALELNFTKEGARNSAVDATPVGGFMQNRGHGTGTIGILAGGDPGPRPGGASGPIGGAPGVQVLPVRIADSVVRFTTSTMVQGFAHALACKADVVSMSMGGRASAALADAINRCYEAGIVMVTAAGNFVGGIPSPRSIVYPARMRRVIAATGVMADGRAYYGLGLGAMQGCHGPDSKMETALAGWTPNIPWAELGCPGTIDLDGAGTSAATPQIAAAAALWIARNRAKLAAYPQAWMRGEAVRQALFGSARGTTAALDAKQVATFLGEGTVDALAALGVAPADAGSLTRAPVASAAWDWVKLLTGSGVGIAAGASPRAAMLGLELLQIAQQDPELEKILPDPEAGTPAPAQRKAYLEAVREGGLASASLKRAIDRALGVGTVSGLPTLPAVRPAKGQPRRAGPANRPEPPANRRLRIFALDPRLGSTLATLESKVATIDVPYEVDRAGDSMLKPGPVGEYIEVVDVDPASDQFYPPVDLDDPRLLLQDGLDPSEGNPQFHQQMVYAVGMRTIVNFETALGRVALWARFEREAGKKYEYVQRLRIYPHALRARNAYYSPDRAALLFGYFPAESRAIDSTAPGTLVFGCLSADIVAHEMTHALLDGYMRGYREPSNPDVGAFHEAFADICALFQHFQISDLVRREIANARGDLGAAGLLGGLAKQFGEGSSKSGPLRDYLHPSADITYQGSFEVHARGSLLVSAVYESFLAIFERRTGDLIRLATGGSGVLAQGAIHPDLVDRLAEEACRAARHVLTMCIRALDYCPPTDISFGGYLRALITADLEVVPEDRYGYRTAFLECFRRRDLLPANLRTVSIDTLRWQHPEGERTADWLRKMTDALEIDWQSNLPRRAIFERAQWRCKIVHDHLQARMLVDPDLSRRLGLQPGLALYAADGTERPNPFTGADGKSQSNPPPGTAFEVRNVRAARRVRPGGRVSEEIIIVLAQRRAELLDPSNPDSGYFWYRGGSTVIIDPYNRDGEPEIRYIICKGLANADRLVRERDFRTNPPTDGLRALYFGDHGLASREPFAALHASED